MRIVLDSNIIIAGMRSRNGASHAILRQIPMRPFIMLASVPLFLEYEAVLKRPEHRAVHGLDLEEVDVVLGVWAACCEAVKMNYLWRPQLTDPKDEMVLETALNGMAGCIVSHNVRDFLPAAEHFSMPVLRPAEFLSRLR